ncbi:PREDICTED: uncharacterized protein LOC109462154 [Branchiostoma belcheri]|uniref:Uncharacterized protein LOC109462154 n=1 Tax=Branchiostoma belcheri TaxID=7741 RepID=A0A6P4XCF5_BRABE|nr:PREDICTED: uncharacterized protein LOC109462154 [Branchiostoma belcheri]
MSTRVLRSRHGRALDVVQRPITLNSVEDVIASLKDPKGASAIAIQRSIQSEHPDMKAEQCKALLRAVLLEGLDSGRLRRPPGSKVGRGLVGRFLLKATDGTSAETLPAVPETQDGTSAEKVPAVPETQDRTSAETLPAVPETQDGTSAEKVPAVPETQDRTSVETLPAVPETQDGTSAEKVPAVPETQDRTSAETLPAVPETQDEMSVEKLPAVPETQDDGHDGDTVEEEEDPPVAAGNLTFDLEEPCTLAAYVQWVQEKRERLMGQCQEAEGYLNYRNLPAHALEQVRIAVGRSRLITSNSTSPLASWLGATSSEQLWDSIRQGNLPSVRRLARSRLVDLNKPFPLHQGETEDCGREELHNPTFLLWACRTADVETVEVLVAAGADVDRCGYVPALRGADWQCSVWDAEKHSHTPLTYATVQRNLQLVRTLLLSCHADPNATNIQHRAPLHFAARLEVPKTTDKNNSDSEKTREEIVNMLLKAGAKADLTDRHGITPLHVAAEKVDKTVCKALLQPEYSRFTNVNAVTKDGRTPLHCMFQYGVQTYDDQIAAIAKMLLKRGASLHVVTRGYTPLHLAAENGLLKSARVLVQAGADIQATTTRGLSPLDLAYRGNHWKLVKYFRRCVDASKSDTNNNCNSTIPKSPTEQPTPVSILKTRCLEKDKKKISVLMAKMDDFLIQVSSEETRENLLSRVEDWLQPKDIKGQDKMKEVLFGSLQKYQENNKQVRKKKKVTFKL